MKRNSAVAWLLTIICMGAMGVRAIPVAAQDTPEGYIYEWETSIEDALEVGNGEVEEDGEVMEADGATEADEGDGDAAEADGEEARHIFVYFAGSDWCPHCMDFEEGVINAPTFRRYLERNFVPVLIDSPRYYTLSEEQQAYNESKQGEYEVTGFPTIVILDPEGGLVRSLGYDGRGANQFIRTLRGIIK